MGAGPRLLQLPELLSTNWNFGSNHIFKTVEDTTRGKYLPKIARASFATGLTAGLSGQFWIQALALQPFNFKEVCFGVHHSSAIHPCRAISAGDITFFENL